MVGSTFRARSLFRNDSYVCSASVRRSRLGWHKWLTSWRKLPLQRHSKVPMSVNTDLSVQVVLGPYLSNNCVRNPDSNWLLKLASGLLTHKTVSLLVFGYDWSNSEPTQSRLRSLTYLTSICSQFGVLTNSMRLYHHAGVKSFKLLIVTSELRQLSGSILALLLTVKAILMITTTSRLLLNPGCQIRTFPRG